MPEQLKNRMLTIFQLLWEQSDEDHPITIRQMQDVLLKDGIKVGRKTVADDILALQAAGYDIVCNKRQQNQYFIGARTFELPELMLLIDAVQATQFIAPRKKSQLIKKLTAQASCHQGAELTQSIKPSNPRYDNNQSIYYMMDWLRTMIAKGRSVAFQYFEYTAQKERVLKHDGQIYVVSPYDLMWNGDRYYLIGYSEIHGKIATFRIDRITNLEPRKEAAKPKPKDYQPQEYRNQVFQMYDAQTYDVTLRCHNSLMTAVIDRFGVDCETSPQDDTHFHLTATISASPTFYAWVFTFGGNMEIVAPQEVVNGYRERLLGALGE